MSTDNQARPGDRFGNAVTPGRQAEFRDARNRPIELEPLPEAKPVVATQMQPKPGENQPASTPGGIPVINPRAHIRQPIENQPPMSLIEAARQRNEEIKAAKALDRAGLEQPRPVARLQERISAPMSLLEAAQQRVKETNAARALDRTSLEDPRPMVRLQERVRERVQER